MKANSLSVFVGCLALFTSMGCAEHIIYSDRTTDWGIWGSLARCPYNTFAASWTQKVEPDQGFFTDDSAQNAIQLNCAPANNPGNITSSVTSSIGPYGSWGSLYSCIPGFISGFNLQVEGNQGPGDDTATNTFRASCTDGKTVDAVGGAWGSFRSHRYCDARHAVCGVQTQVESAASDETALNNVNLLCCPLPNLARECEPKERYRVINICDNSKSNVESTCEFEVEVGVGYVRGSTEAAGWEGAGFTLEDAVHDLPETFKTHQKLSKEFPQSTFIKKNTVKSSVTIPAGTKTTISRLTAECAHYAITSRTIKREDAATGNVVVSTQFNI